MLWLPGCGFAPQQTTPHAAEGPPSLDGRLAAIEPSTDPRTTLTRSALLRALGRQENALGEIAASEAVQRQNLDWNALAELSREAGAIYLEMGRPQPALEAFGRRLEIGASLERRTLRASALVDMGHAFALLGSVSRADELLTEARLLGGTELFDDPLAAERTALTRARLHDPDRAIELFTQAVDGYQSSNDRNGAARAAVYRARLQNQGQDESAFDDVESMVSHAWDSESTTLLARYRAEAAHANHAFERCAELADKAARLADQRGLVPTSKLARVTLARCAARIGDIDRAVEAARSAAYIAEAQHQDLTGERARRESGFEAFQIYRLLLELQLRLPEARRDTEVFETMERARARAHLDAVQRGRHALEGVVSVDPLLLSRQEDLEAQVRRLTQEVATSRRDPRVAERHRNALWALADVKEEIQQANPLLARITLPPPATIDSARDVMLKEGGLLVAYFMAEGQAVGLAVDQTTTHLEVLSATPSELLERVQKFRSKFLLRPNSPTPALRAKAEELYRDVLGPFDELVRRHEDIVIIPHGALASLPFEALVNDRGYLVEHHRVRYSLSATVAIELDRVPPPTAERIGFVGFGDPVYDYPAFVAQRAEAAPPEGSRGLELFSAAHQITHGEKEPARPALKRIPGTGREVRAIAQLFGNDQRTYLRADATEERFKEGAAANARIVHIASHGVLEPHYQALVLTLNPDSEEDGFLLGSELVGVDLNADLMVLSGCNTGNTRQRAGEPIAGLALALRSAGARRVLLSLWSVDDAATAQLMTALYEPLVKQSASYTEALTSAKRQLLKGPKAHPYYWAPFVLFGG